MELLEILGLTYIGRHYNKGITENTLKLSWTEPEIVLYLEALSMIKSQIYNYDSYFHFNDCDPAGIFYFGNVPNLCHRVYENWLTQLKPDWNFWFNNPEWIVPIKSCTTDYLSPMKAGTAVRIQLTIVQMSQSSFTSSFHAFHPDTNVSYFKTQIVHVFVQKSTFTKSPIPETIRPLFEPFLASRSQ
jgi:acyl-CoA thioesterase FadM